MATDPRKKKTKSYKPLPKISIPKDMNKISSAFQLPKFVAIIHDDSISPIAFSDLKDAICILFSATSLRCGCTILRTEDGKKYTNLADLYDDNQKNRT